MRTAATRAGSSTPPANRTAAWRWRLLAAAVSHTPEGEEVLRGARMRMARKPSAVARELLRNFPKGGKRRRKRGKRPAGENGSAPEAARQGGDGEQRARKKSKPRKRRKATAAKAGSGAGEVDLAGPDGDAVAAGGEDEQVAPVVDAVGDA